MINTTEQIWYQLHGDLRAFIGRRVSDESAADDILQDVFTRIHLHANTLRDDTKLSSWIYQITRNAIVDYYRSRKSDASLPETIVFDDYRDEDDLASRLAPCLRGMIDELPAKYREALLLTEFEGFTQAALAHQLGLSLPGAKSRVQRAREQLKNILLQCCHLEFDHLGRLIDYHPNCDGCGSSDINPEAGSECS